MTDLQTAQLIEQLKTLNRFHTQSTRVWLYMRINEEHEGFIKLERNGHAMTVTASDTAFQWADDVLHKRI